MRGTSPIITYYAQNKLRLPIAPPNHIRSVMRRSKAKWSLSSDAYKAHENEMNRNRRAVSEYLDGIYNDWIATQ